MTEQRPRNAEVIRCDDEDLVQKVAALTDADEVRVFYKDGRNFVCCGGVSYVHHDLGLPLLHFGNDGTSNRLVPVASIRCMIVLH